jgi:hypothetical protein
MGFQVKIEGGSGSFEISRENILTVEYKSDIPADSNARSKDQGATLTVAGKILTGLGGLVGDATIELGKWSLVPAESAEAYRSIKVDVLSANQVVRSYTFPNAFVIDYKEDYSDTSGTGKFTLVARQKKDKLAGVAIEGGYAF